MPASRDETEDLRREFEVHLSYLEDEALESGASPRDAARRATERFGNVMEHFHASVEDMNGRQRAMRQFLVAAMVCGALAIVGGTVATVFILKRLHSEVMGLRSEFAASATELNQANVSCVILRAQWDDPPGRPNTLRIPVMMDDWNKWVAASGLTCSADEAPSLSWTAQGWVAHGYHIREGATIWFSPERVQDMLPEAAGTAESAFKLIAAQAQTVKCLPRQSVSPAGL